MVVTIFAPQVCLKNRERESYNTWQLGPMIYKMSMARTFTSASVRYSIHRAALIVHTNYYIITIVIAVQNVHS